MNEKNQGLTTQSGKGGMITEAAMQQERRWFEMLDVVRKMSAPSASPAEFEVFCYQAKRTGLDPLAKQIHMITRKEGDEGATRSVIQVGIDGFRLIAHRTKDFAGSDPAKFGPLDGKGFPAWCQVTVYRLVQGARCPFVATAYWKEYYPKGKGSFMWDKRPMGQLEKCCEALALRKAFPAELSGIYEETEMDQAGAPVHQEFKAAEVMQPAPQQPNWDQTPGSNPANEVKREAAKQTPAVEGHAADLQPPAPAAVDPAKLKAELLNRITGTAAGKHLCANLGTARDIFKVLDANKDGLGMDHVEVFAALSTRCRDIMEGIMRTDTTTESLAYNWECVNDGKFLFLPEHLVTLEATKNEMKVKLPSRKERQGR